MVAKVYGRFVPNTVERDRWDRAAAALDKVRWANQIEMGTVLGTVAEDEKGQPPVSDWPASSRGGTRTRDPGIMSGPVDPPTKGSSSDGAA